MFSVVLAIGLNLAALGALGAVVSGWRAGGAVAATPAAWITTVFLAPRPTAEPAPSALAAAAQRIPEQDKAVAPPAPKPTPVATALPAPKQPAPSDAANAVRYYRTGEVDHPAQPDSDWNLDTAALDAAGLSTLVFEVFVGPDGEIVGCAILEPRAIADATRASLEARLRQTVLRPAERGGVAVPSVRRIEISVLPALQ